MEKEDIKQAINEVLDNRNRVDAETHEHHHKIAIPKMISYIDGQMDKDKIHKIRAEKIKTQIIGWGIIVFLSGIGTAVYTWFAHFVNNSNGAS